MIKFSAEVTFDNLKFTFYGPAKTPDDFIEIVDKIMLDYKQYNLLITPINIIVKIENV